MDKKPSSPGRVSLLSFSCFTCDFLASLFWSVLFLVLLWLLAERVDEPWAYVCLGAALMFFPCQCAFWLGRKSVVFPVVNTGITSKEWVTRCTARMQSKGVEFRYALQEAEAWLDSNPGDIDECPEEVAEDIMENWTAD